VLHNAEHLSPVLIIFAIYVIQWFDLKSPKVSIVTRLRVRRPKFDSRQGQKPFLFATASRPALGSTQHPIQWVAEALTPMVKQPGREADHSPSSGGEVKNAWSYTSTGTTIPVAILTVLLFGLQFRHFPRPSSYSVTC